MHAYEVRPRTDHRDVDLIWDVLPFGRLWYDGPNAVANAIGYAEHHSRSHHAVIRVYDAAGNVIETHEHKSDFKTVISQSMVSTCNRTAVRSNTSLTASGQNKRRQRCCTVEKTRLVWACRCMDLDWGQIRLRLRAWRWIWLKYSQTQ